MPSRILVAAYLVIAIIVGPGSPPRPAHAEPRELLLGDGTVIGAIAVGVPPEWQPVAERLETYRAILRSDGPWTRMTVGGGARFGRERPRGEPLELTLGRSLDAVPSAPRHAFRAANVDLTTLGGEPMGSFRCPTTEVLATADDGRARVRLYRSGPSGERYILEGWVADAPRPSSWCPARVAYVDTGTLPDYWVRVAGRLPRFEARGPLWWRSEGRCERWAFYGSQLVRREEKLDDERDGCTHVTVSRIDVTVYPTHLIVLRNRTDETRSSCAERGGGLSASGGTGEQIRFVAYERDRQVWRWVRTGSVAQDPVAFHPDDPELWSRTRAGCEASLD